MRGGRREGAGRPQGARNKRTAAVETAMQVVAAKFRDEVPTAFDGDGVAYLQTVYRDPAHPVSVRLDAAAKSARYERPALAATVTRDVTPEAEHKLALDYSRYTPEQLLALRKLIAIGLPTDLEQIEGEAEECCDDDA